MTSRLPTHTLMVTFVHDALKAREITIEHLADLLAPTEENTIRSWFDGRSAPVVSDLLPLAEALRMSPVELTAGWLIDRCPDLEPRLRVQVLEPLRSNFPASTDLTLRAPRPRIDMNVGDPHDEREPAPLAPPVVGKTLRKSGRRREGI
jgi:hypothetical protein